MSTRWIVFGFRTIIHLKRYVKSIWEIYRPMKRRKAKRNKATRPTTQSATIAKVPMPSRRHILQKVRSIGLGAAVVASGGWFFIRDVQATMRENDLSRIGNGVVTVVQIHDPQCPLCQTLQRESRAAVCDIGSDKLQFLVADIRTEAGRKFARIHNVRHVTLLLLDGDGRRHAILTGPNKRDHLEGVFRRHLKRYGDV